jgi:UDPglucose 6-dehydrogenase
MNREKIGIIGQGFVGNAVKEGMKNHFELICFDKDPNKFSNVKSISEVIKETDVCFLCVPTPMKSTGECDLSIVRSALTEIHNCKMLLNKEEYIVVIKSTIPPGTTDLLNSEFNGISIVFNPEFLTEANAVNDYIGQNRIIIGGERPASSKVKRIFSKAFPKIPIIKTSSTIAETIKYVTNTFLAMKVSYANEIHQMCQALNIDYDKVIEYARYDDRLGNSHWSVPGPDGDFGFGGHCFPKDIGALQYLVKKLGVDDTMLSATILKNQKVRTDLDWTKQVGRAVSKEE